MTQAPLPAINAKGEPVGQEDAAKRIRPPNGVSTDDWIALIELAATHFRRTSGVGKPTKEILRAYDVDDTIPEKTWKLVFDYQHNFKNFEKALAVRGVLPLGVGLSPVQSLAIDIMSDPSQGTFKIRLKKANITAMQWQMWMLDPNFAEQFNLLTTRRMNANKGLIDVTLTEAALSGSLEAIKYYDKRVGRDPDKRNELDGRKVVAIVVDVLTRQLVEYPDLMRKIFAELEVRTKFNDGDVQHTDGPD